MTRNTACFDDGWQFCPDERIEGLATAWTNDEKELLGFEHTSTQRDGVNWQKAGRCYGPASRDFEDADWLPVSLPHDWSVTQTPRSIDHPRNGFLRGGVVWYRKAFRLDPADVGDDRRVALRFDGVYRDASVFVNGHLVGLNRSGYIGFCCEISDVVVPGENVVGVRVDGSAKEGWFYEGTGIYRHVWLITGSRRHIAEGGVRIDTEIKDPAGTPTATVRVAVEVVSDLPADTTGVGLRVRIRDTAEHVVAESEAVCSIPEAGRCIVALPPMQVPEPRLWSLEQRDRYVAEAEVVADGQAVDRVRVRFGLRTIRFDTDQGFFLNEQPIKLKGVCCHQDHAGVGMAIPDALQRWRLERLKDMGANAYRASHNPPTPELLDLCDELGILVMDELRCFGISDEAVSQLERLVKRDRHHPSVVLWSLANEEMAIQGGDVGRRMYRTLKHVVHRHDRSRPVTAGVNENWDRPTGFIECEDVHGINYLNLGSLEALRAARPDLPVLVAEASSQVSTRGEYANDSITGVMAEYDDHTDPEADHMSRWPFWGRTAEASWREVDEHAYLAGTFVWTGFDYRGEQTPYVRWPAVGSHFGIMDLCGFPKDRFFYYQAWWSDRDVLHLLPHWTWPGREGQAIDVWSYTNCSRVELILNGRSCGSLDVTRNGHASWSVPYEPGVLEAVGQTADGRELRTRVKTAGAAEAIILQADRTTDAAGGSDLAVVSASVVDADGTVVPHADDPLRFELRGGGRLAGLGNGDPNSHEPDQPVHTPTIGLRRVYHGLAQVLVAAPELPAEVSLVATAHGLRGSEIVLPFALNTPVQS